MSVMSGTYWCEVMDAGIFDLVSTPSDQNNSMGMLWPDAEASRPMVGGTGRTP